VILPINGSNKSRNHLDKVGATVLKRYLGKQLVMLQRVKLPTKNMFGKTNANHLAICAVEGDIIPNFKSYHFSRNYRMFDAFIIQN
jgi:hypothetical protein